MIVVFCPPAERRLYAIPMDNTIAKARTTSNTTKNQTGIAYPHSEIEERCGLTRVARSPKRPVRPRLGAEAIDPGSA
jgi:hypothetical protein